NVFVGANGAGKTSVLEAVFLLSHARSFRSGAREALLQRDMEQLSVFAELRHADGRGNRVGLGRGGGSRWDARVDGESVAIGQLVRECAVVCFEPGSHALIAGAAEERRRYLDWGVFHVEQDFLSTWRRHQRALKQRNSLLRLGNGVVDDLFVPWEAELAQSAQQIDAQRSTYLDLLRPRLQASATSLLPELGAIELRYRRGWSDERDLAVQLHEQRPRDLARGHTTLGAHRAGMCLGAGRPVLGASWRMADCLPGRSGVGTGPSSSGIRGRATPGGNGPGAADRHGVAIDAAGSGGTSVPRGTRRTDAPAIIGRLHPRRLA